MTVWKWPLEKVVIATEIVSFMAEHEAESGRKISLEKAYEEKGVSKDMRLKEDEIKKIVSDILA